MKDLAELLAKGKRIRVAGFDDAPFSRARGSVVNIAGIVCSDTRFEGMLWGRATKDGRDATETIIEMLRHSKFYRQINVVLLDGIAVGGFNVIDLPRLCRELDLPCIAVMRKPPQMTAIKKALDNFADGGQRWQLIERAGKIHQVDDFCYQVVGCDAPVAARVLQRLTDVGHVPEALRLAHLIGAAVITGQSSNRA